MKTLLLVGICLVLFALTLFGRRTNSTDKGIQEMSSSVSSDTSSYHPLFLAFKTKAVTYLTDNGFELFKEQPSRWVYSNPQNVYVSIVDQKRDGPELWIGKNDSAGKIRIGFILELYLTGGIELTLKNKISKSFYEENTVFDYYSEFLSEHFDKILEIEPFPDAYYEWQDSEEGKSAIQEQILKLRKIPND